ncbi:hemolysin family protein [Ornithinicoccus halotolerans]|uniref:hemolysin family protein n=1 Tax=Ornithinicoccus halotolerans TaxID=1748220 RepID=UPI001295E629|nr:hemolysin family protein [Ornithinicoccus halotolerans]
MTEWVLLLVVALLIGANALFVAAEFSLVTVDRASVERRAEGGDGRARSLLAARQRLSTQLSGAQLGITITSLVVGYIAEPSIATLLRGPIGLAGLSDAATGATAFAVAFALATGAQMVFGELVPKNWAIAEPMRVGRAVAGWQRAFTTASKPLLLVLNGSANAIVRAVGIEPAEELASARSPHELASLTARSAAHGSLEPGAAELFTRSVEFGDRRAADAMTPRPRVQFVHCQTPVRDVLELSGSTGLARFPVYADDVDDVVGVVHFKHALGVSPEERGHRTVAEIVHDLPAVPSSMELDPLLRLLRRSGTQMALVVDEYGGTDGIVTLEDLVEEIVGEILDEQDRPLGRYRSLGDGRWSLSGLLRPDEVEDLIGLRLPAAAESDTLGGLLTEHLGRLPAVADAVTMPAEDLRNLDGDGVPAAARVSMEVTRLDGRRVDHIHLRQETVPEEDGDE